MKNLLLGLIILSTGTSFAEDLKVGTYTDPAEVSRILEGYLYDNLVDQKCPRLLLDDVKLKTNLAMGAKLEGLTITTRSWDKKVFIDLMPILDVTPSFGSQAMNCQVKRI